jgi:hypothetical protein
LVACGFQKEFCANPRNVSTNRNRGIALAVFKRVWQLQAVLVLGRQKTQFNIKIK